MFKLSDALNAIHRVPIQLLVVLALAIALILFIPEDIAATLALDQFRTNYRIYLGPGLVVIGAWLATRLVVELGVLMKERQNQKNLHQRLFTLTQEEKGYLAVFIEKGATTINVPVEDGIIGGLLAKRIVFRSSNAFNLVDGVPYNLQTWARTYLDANPHLLAGAVGRPMTPREKLRAARW